jgi:hypothetical protein
MLLIIHIGHNYSRNRFGYQRLFAIFLNNLENIVFNH